MDVCMVTGCTPLLAAISGRQWNTAKLIVAILAAQYAPEEDLPKFDTSDVSLGTMPSLL